MIFDGLDIRVLIVDSVSAEDTSFGLIVGGLHIPGLIVGSESLKRGGGFRAIAAGARLQV